MAKQLLSVRADLDVPGETKRQIGVFGIWLLCLTFAVALSVVRRPTSADLDRPVADDRMAAYQRERIFIVGIVGLCLPGLLTWLVTHRRRRGGPHARGIVVDVTDDNELRIWGRGYGQRIKLDGADVSERLVDVYTGRLGAWRQRRLIVRGKQAVMGMSPELALATVAKHPDDSEELGVIGGEGDCVELSRSDFLEVRAEVVRIANI